MDKYSRKAAREGGFFAWSELRDVEDAVPYGRGMPSPTRFYPVISTRVPSLSSTQLS